MQHYFSVFSSTYPIVCWHQILLLVLCCEDICGLACNNLDQTPLCGTRAILICELPIFSVLFWLCISHTSTVSGRNKFYYLESEKCHVQYC
jgi:hypothetical protein